MPLVKRQSGWFWGSKGPFDSKAKALAVARAAYASGYKGESNLVIAVDISESGDKSANITGKFRKAMRKFS
jgi:hypothetical protein